MSRERQFNDALYECNKIEFGGEYWRLYVNWHNVHPLRWRAMLISVLNLNFAVRQDLRKYREMSHAD